MQKNTYRLTYPQQNIMFVERFNKNSSINVITGLFNIKKDFNEKSCEKAINDVIKNNIAMRARVSEEEGEFSQYFCDYIYEEIEVVDMSSFSKEETLEYIDGIASQSLFALNSKLYSFKILKYSEDSGSILMSVHHIISDAWSCSKIGDQLLNTIENYSLKVEDEFEEQPSYIEYINSEVEYENSEKYIKDEEFWKEYLKGLEETISLKDKTTQTSNTADRYSVKLDKDFNDKVLEFCKENRISPYALFLAAISTYLYRIKDKNDFILGSPVLNRANFKEKKMLGMFVSTLPLRIKIEENESFLELAKKIGKDTLSVFRHQKYPYMKTLENVRKNSNIKTNLYNIVLSYQNARTDIVNEEKYSTGWAFSKTLEDELQIHIMDMDDTGILNINYDYKTELFEKIEIKYIHTRLLAIIQNAIEDISVNVEDIRIMSKEEEHKILYEFNDTYKEYPQDKTVIELFEEQVEKTPNNVALIYDGESISYKDFYNMICNFALKLSNVSNENILVCLENSIEMIISIYGILMSGNTYVPINIDTPIDRIVSIANDCDCKFAVMKEELLENVRYLSVEKNNNENIFYNKSHSKELAYIIYTSGSTGNPKGVKICNKSLTNYIYWAKETYVSDKEPIMPLYSSVSFDLTVTTLFLPLISGGTIAIYKNTREEIIKIFKEDKVNMIKLTPAHLALVNEANMEIDNVDTLIIGGEALQTSDVKKIIKQSKKELNVFNEYGPTEATVGCMKYRFNESDNESTVSIGQPIANTKIYIMDKRKRLCPLFIDGEIYIEGECISTGYNNLSEKTKESFVLNPITKRIMYKSKDIGRLGFDVQLRYIGRADNQIKINGYRIELEEIENTAKKITKLKNVVADVKYISNIPNIILYYVSDIKFEKEYIKEALRKELPYYMIPVKYIKINSIPVNKNGKIVRNLLPIPQKDKVSIKIEYINELEEKVCAVWQEILGVKVNPKCNIFDEYGVDSLNIIRCQVKLSKFINIINIQKFYEYPIIREFCNHIYEENSDYSNNQELEKYRNINCSKPYFKDKRNNNVILLGATGFLGIHILKELLSYKEINNIYCIVRGNDYKKRLKDIFNFYFSDNYSDLYNKKVKVLYGNVEKKNFGLSNEELLKIIKNTDRVINAAAVVKHYGNYSYFKLINVNVVKNIVDICKEYDMILEQISTISIAGDSSIETFDESKFYIGQNYKINPYIQTKFEAELYIYKMINEQGLRANVYRVGNLTWRHEDGVYQKNVLSNGFFMRLKNILFLKAYPTSFKNLKIEMTPVDICSNFICSLMFKVNRVNEIYHVYNPNSINFLHMLKILQDNDSKDNTLKEVSDEDFMELLQNYDSKENVLLNDIISSIGTIDALVDNEYTVKKLKICNKIWPILDKEYVVKVSDYLNKYNRGD